MNAIYAEPPPVVLQAEQSLLGAIMANNKAYEAVGAFLLPEHFAQPVHGHLYRKMAEIIGKGRLVDALTLKIEFEHAGILTDFGGTAYLADLLSAMVGILPAIEYGKAIKDAWVRREAMAVMEESRVSCSLRTGEQSGQEIVSEAIARLSELAEGSDARTSSAQAAKKMIANAQAAYQGHPGFERLEVGLPSVDRLLGGLWPSDLYCLMAFSGTGKTPALLQICRNVARGLENGEHVHLFSLEIPTEAIVRINVGAESRWTAAQIRAGEIGEARDWIELEAITNEIAKLPIEIDDKPIDLDNLRLRAREVKRKRKTRLIAVDYLELIKRDHAHRNMPKNEWIPTLRQELKELAVELETPIFVLSQINKPPKEDREPRRPVKEDLPYDSGQAIDGLHALYRREMHMGDEPPGFGALRSDELRATEMRRWAEDKRAAQGHAEWILLRDRLRVPGSAILRFDGPRLMFREAQ